VEANQQAQSISYSLEDGMTWTMYDAGNLVILAPPTDYANQILEFRDPSIMALWRNRWGG
jgi:beta-fructofuranosidase/levanase